MKLLKNKKYWFIGFVFILLLISIIVVSQKKTIPIDFGGSKFITSSPPSPVPTVIVTQNDSLLHPSEITWSVDQLYIPHIFSHYTIETKPINGLVTNLTRQLGFSGSAKINNDQFVLFVDPVSHNSFYIDTNLKLINYSRDIQKNPLKPIPITRNEDIVRSQLTNLSKSILGDTNDLTMEIDKSDYQTNNESKYYGTLKNDSKYIQLSGHYLYKDMPIYSKSGYSVVARYDWNGTLINFQFSIPFTIKSTLTNDNLMTFQEIKTTPLSDYLLINMYGNTDLEKTNSLESVKNATITMAQFGLFSENDQLSPVIIAKGNTLLSIGPANVIFAIKAIKQ